MKKYIFILFIVLFVASDSLWACAKSLMPTKQKVIKVDLSESELLDLNSALIDVAKDGRLTLVKLLLAAGADVNHQNPTGETALMHASRQGYIDVVKVLLEAGANVNLQDNFGWTALSHVQNDMARWKNSTMIRNLTEVVKVLKEAGATE